MYGARGTQSRGDSSTLRHAATPVAREFVVGNEHATAAFSEYSRLVLQLLDSVRQPLDCVPCDHLSWVLSESGRERLIFLELSVYFLHLKRAEQFSPFAQLPGRARICEHSIVYSLSFASVSLNLDK
jgi:hypothetical protein